MSLRSLVRSAGLRFALLSTLAFMAAISVVGWITILTVTAALEEQAQTLVENEAGALVDEFNDGGRPDLEAALAGRFANSFVHIRYAVVEPDGRVSLGDSSLVPFAGAPTAAVGKGTRVARRTLDDGSRIVVADDLVKVRAIETVVTRAFLSALAITALLGLAAGIVLSRALLRRLDAVTRMAEAVVAGDLTQRIASNGSGDEFDRLAATLNRMLDRISGLLDNLRQVSTDIAHDLRTPLSRLRQGLEIAGRKSLTVESYKGVVDQAIEETDRILDIFSALLRIAQIEGGMRRDGFRPVELSELLLTIVDAYAAPAAEGGRVLEAEIAPDIQVDGDRDLLAQLLANLVENALQHTPPGSTIHLSLAARRGTAEIVVRDDGPGIPAAEQERVFRRFYRLERSRTSPGNGLGLSIVAAVADLHAGRIVLADMSPGLRVGINLPCAGSLGPP